MSLAIQPLPDDPDELRRFAADLQAELARKDIEITARDAEIHAKTLHIEKLKMQLAVLRRGKRKLVPTVDGQRFGFQAGFGAMAAL
jgi:transposase